jgi:two-component system, OmpR family, KDP operon response regulator KdpE
MTRVLVVDDEPQILRALRINLRARQYEVNIAATGTEALTVAAAHPPDLVILDLGLPDMDGVEVIGGLRGWTAVPIIVLSGRADSTDKVDALDAGADDYVTKPFGMDELLARMRAAVRRTPAAEAPPRVRLGDLVVDLAAKRVTRNAGTEGHPRPGADAGPGGAARAGDAGGSGDTGSAGGADGANRAGDTDGADGANRAGDTGGADGANRAGDTGGMGGANRAGDTGGADGANRAGDTGGADGANRAGGAGGAAGARDAGGAADGADAGEAGGAGPQPDGDIRLTPTEWHLLEVLLRNPGKLLSRRQLLNDVWGPGYDNASGNLRLYMAQLRRKLEPDPARPRWLVTEPGMGYRYQPPDPAERAADSAETAGTTGT